MFLTVFLFDSAHKKALPTIRTGPFDCGASSCVVAGEGFEPPTFGLCVPLQLSLPG